MNKIYGFLLRPLTASPLLLGCLFLFALPVIPIVAKGGMWPVLVYLSSSFVVAYILTALVIALHFKWLRRLAVVMAIAILVVMLVVDTFSMMTYGEELNRDCVGLIFETNIHETLEFMKSYIRPSFVVGIVVGSIIVVTGVIFGLRTCYRFNRSLGTVMSRYPLAIIGLLSVTFTVVVIGWLSGARFAEKHPLVRASYFLDHKDYPNLKDYKSKLQAVPITTSHPHTVIIIIGESMMRNHCSLYGYDKETTPGLEELKRKGNLVAFDNVTSLATKTMRSLKTILSSYREEGTNWWEHPTVIDVADACGYSTSWISAQERNGVYDVLATQYALLCDSATFISDTNFSPYDGSLLSIDPGPGPRMIFYHLAGQHPAFSQRYPSGFGRFSTSDYADKPEWQRVNYADYDNAVLYTDSIVTEIFHSHADENAVAILLSDHGLDFYTTDPYYCAHARNNNSASLRIARDIPFAVWMSDSYRAGRPDIDTALRSNVHRSWCVSEMFFLLPHLLGYSIPTEPAPYPLI